MNQFIDCQSSTETAKKSFSSQSYDYAFVRYILSFVDIFYQVLKSFCKTSFVFVCCSRPVDCAP